MKKNDLKFLQISPLSFLYKNNSIQESLSKDFSFIKSQKKYISSSKKYETPNNSSNYNHINNYFNINYSASSARDKSKEFLKEKIVSAGFRTNYKKGLLYRKKTTYHTLKYRPKRLTNFSNIKSFSKISKISYNKGINDTEKIPFRNVRIDKAKSAHNLLFSPKNKLNLDITNSENFINKNIIIFKANQIEMFSRTSNNFKGLKKYLPYVSQDIKPKLESFLTKIENNVEMQKSTLFIDNEQYNLFNSSSKEDNININSTDYLLSNNIKNKYDSYANTNNCLFNNKVMFNFLNMLSEYNILVNKCFEVIFNELKQIKIKHRELRKSNYET